MGSLKRRAPFTSRDPMAMSKSVRAGGRRIPHRHRRDRVAHEAVLSLCFQHAEPDRQTLAALRAAYHMQIRVLPGKALGDFEGAIGAAVLDDQDFGRVTLLLKKSEHLLQRAGQASLLVVSRDDG